MWRSRDKDVVTERKRKAYHKGDERRLLVGQRRTLLLGVVVKVKIKVLAAELFRACLASVKNKIALRRERRMTS